MYFSTGALQKTASTRRPRDVCYILAQSPIRCNTPMPASGRQHLATYEYAGGTAAAAAAAAPPPTPALAPAPAAAAAATLL